MHCVNFITISAWIHCNQFIIFGHSATNSTIATDLRFQNDNTMNEYELWPTALDYGYKTRNLPKMHESRPCWHLAERVTECLETQHQDDCAERRQSPREKKLPGQLRSETIEVPCAPLPVAACTMYSIRHVITVTSVHFLSAVMQTQAKYRYKSALFSTY